MILNGLDSRGLRTPPPQYPRQQPWSHAIPYHTSEERDKGNKAADIASALIGAKRAQLAALQDRLATALALFGQGLAGAGAHALHVSGTGGNALLRNELLGAAGAPGPELSFCAGVALVGGAGSLVAIREVLGA